jgi:predicted transcriptional regulator
MPKAELPLLTAVELEMMQILWKFGPSTVPDVLRHLDRKLAYTSVLTMLRILEQKGYAARVQTEGSRAHIYSALVPQQRVQRRHLRDLLERFFQDRPEELVTGLLEHENLSRRDLSRLKALVEQRLDETPKGGKRS